MSRELLQPEEVGIGPEWEIARERLAGVLPRRWSHSQGVFHQALLIGPHVTPGEEELLARAAILHDVGYSPEIAHTGFHPLDGARYLRSVGVDEQVVAMVAHHSCARIEAELRGLAGELDDFQPGPAGPTDALIFCDMTISPDGLPVTVDTTITEVVDRYGPESLVGQFMELAGPELRAATARVDERLSPPGSDPGAGAWWF